MNEEILKKNFGYDNPYAKDLDQNNEASWWWLHWFNRFS